MTVTPDPDEISAAFGLGQTTAPLVEAARGGGGHNVVYRLETTSGCWAIKAMVRELDDLTAERFEIEMGAFEGGIPMPRPVPTTSGMPVADISGLQVRCHEWVPGTAKTNEQASVADAARMGQLVAALHGLDLPWSSAFDQQAENAGPPWSDLATEGRRRGAGWGLTLADHLTEMTAIADRVAALSERDLSATRVGSHRDLNAHNVLFAGGDLSLIDWDAAGPASPAWERANYSTLWSARAGGGYDESAIVAFLSAYRDAGGQLTRDDPDTLELLLVEVEDWARKSVKWAAADPTGKKDENADLLIRGLLNTPATIETRRRLLQSALETCL